jgi:hypothetical protein
MGDNASTWILNAIAVNKAHRFFAWENVIHERLSGASTSSAG